MKKIGNCFGLHSSKWHNPKLLLSLLLFFVGLNLMAQERRIEGIVLDSNNEPLYGVTVVVKSQPGVGIITDANGKFSLPVDDKNSVLVFSFLGMESQTIDVKNMQQVRVVMKEDSKIFDEVIIVGYGQQKKESVVGAITQTTGKILERAGGVTNLGNALTGNLPGVVTSTSTGMPGAEDPKIVIRTLGSWNSQDPLVLVDGVERAMGNIDIASVETISVLKDASATAIYGVKGANGVILITTKRGQEGKANVQVRANATAKVVSKLPEKYDSYDALVLRNKAIERELMISPGGWGDYLDMEVISKYRNPTSPEDWDRYPNVDWEDELFKDYAMTYNASVNVSGGTKTVKYFSAIDYVNEGDMFKTFDNDRGYNAGFGYNRINVRGNMDFDITNTTKFSSNLFASNGVRQVPWAMADDDAAFWSSAYRSAPDAMRPIYSDGMWGWYAPRNADVPNSVFLLANSGVEKRTLNQISTDFILAQNLDMITKGLKFRGSLSMDNRFQEQRRGINDLYNSPQRKWINPASGDVAYESPIDNGSKLDFSYGTRWQSQNGAVDPTKTFRKTFYQLQLDYGRDFGKHGVTAMGVFNREKNATGNEFPRYREDWAFRMTYNYALKYFLEANGAYNGSEKYGPDFRFDFFPSVSGGWMLTEENFMKTLDFIDMFKLRASYGRIGDDRAGGRFLYSDQWAAGGNAIMYSTAANNSPYVNYRITQIGNPNIAWEISEKRNFGIDYSFFNNLVAGSVDVFRDDRSNIIMTGGQRSIPTYFGATAPTANLGEVETNGYEVELRLQKQFANNSRVYINSSMTHAKNKIINRDDPQLLPDYMKQQGYAINQARSYIDNGFMATYDDVYASTYRTTGNSAKLPGDYQIVDFNGNGIIDEYDRAPYQYSNIPQNTYSSTIGGEFKGFGLMVQFYGVNNVTREVQFPTFHSTSNVAFVEGTYWTVEDGGDIPLPRRTTSVGPDAAGTRYYYDGSYLRLKNAEISYTFNNKAISKIGFKSCRLYLNGSNLWLWTKLPDDRESNFSSNGNSSVGAYPTAKRFNLGIDITL